MRIYMHFEEEEPNHTAALNCTSPDTTFADLLEQFVGIYNERFGADLDADSLELKNSKKKKMKRDQAVDRVLADKEDLFVHRAAKSPTRMPPPKPRPAPPQAPAVPVPGPAHPPPSVHRPAEPQERARGVGGGGGGGDEDDLEDVTAAVQKGIASLPTNDRFRFAQDRVAAAYEDDEQDLDNSSPVPTHEHNVQSNCLKCQQHMFYKSTSGIVSCPHCSFLHCGIECAKCGTFFPAGHENNPVGCPVCRHVDSLDAFRARQKLSFAKSPAPAPPLREPNEIHVIVQYYIDKNPVRQAEVDECLRQNMACQHIRHVHVLTEKPMDLNHFQRRDKLVQYVQGNWLQYNDALLYAQRFLTNKVVIIANADIYMDDSLMHVRGMDMGGRCLALTRHDVVRGGGRRFNAGAAPISQDAWVFKAPLPETVLPACAFHFGKPGCDNRFAFELRAAGLRVTNPCFQIIANHLHESDLRNYVHGRDTVHGAYAAVIPVHALR